MILIAGAVLMLAGALVIVGVASGSLTALVGSIVAAVVALAVLALAVLRSHRSADGASAGPDRPAGGSDPSSRQRPVADGWSHADPEDEA